MDRMLKKPRIDIEHNDGAFIGHMLLGLVSLIMGGGLSATLLDDGAVLAGIILGIVALGGVVRSVYRLVLAPAVHTKDWSTVNKARQTVKAARAITKDPLLKSNPAALSITASLATQYDALLKSAVSIRTDAKRGVDRAQITNERKRRLEADLGTMREAVNALQDHLQAERDLIGAQSNKAGADHAARNAATTTSENVRALREYTQQTNDVVRRLRD